MEDDDHEPQSSHAWGTLIFIFSSILLLTLLTSVVSIERPVPYSARAASPDNGCGVHTFFATFFGVFDTIWDIGAIITDVALSPLESLTRRDDALRELSQNYWTGIFDPALPGHLAQQRRLPNVLAGEIAVAALQFFGLPLHAAGLTMLGVAITGRSFPDLWAMGSLTSLNAPMMAAGYHMGNSPFIPAASYL